MLSDLFQNSQFLGSKFLIQFKFLIFFLVKWIEHFLKKDPSGQIMKYLQRISEFFGVVIVAFTIIDIKNLLLRYLSKSKESFEVVQRN